MGRNWNFKLTHYLWGISPNYSFSMPPPDPAIFQIVDKKKVFYCISRHEMI